MHLECVKETINSMSSGKMQDLMWLPCDILPSKLYKRPIICSPVLCCIYSDSYEPRDPDYCRLLQPMNLLACLVCAFIPVKYNVHNFSTAVYNLNNFKTHNLFQWNDNKATSQTLFILHSTFCMWLGLSTLLKSVMIDKKQLQKKTLEWKRWKAFYIYPIEISRRSI